MKTSFVHSLILPLVTIALTTSMPTIASNQVADLTNHSYEEKKTASEFWAEFKQDSAQTWHDSKSAFKDGWIEGKLATALSLNKHLAPFEIDIQVDNHMATLKGMVHSDVEKELAANIALGVEGIDTVTNKITVTENPTDIAKSHSAKGRNFSQYVADVTTTAAIKTELLASKNIKGLAIEVDTLNAKVTLSGRVKSKEEKALAQAIAAKHNDVKGVINNLRVES
jgi:hyperosmotically inducible protein